jgi:hypothetical protein
MWERILGTGTSGPPPPDGAPERLYAALEAAGRGDRGDWEEALDEIGAAPLPAFLRAEVDALRELADWSAPSTRCAEWIGGTTDAPPFALDGASGTTRARAFVLAAPGRAPRRVLALGRSLCERETHAQTIGDEAEQARTDSTVAALLLAGPEGVPVETLFERIYGFPHHERHDGVWRVLLHRVRARVEGWATLEHAQRHVSVVPRGPVLFPDARCERADAEVLAYAAAHGVLVAKDIAEALGVPLRRAQDALKRLAEGGLFRATSEGRVVRYVLEDTTFGEPTPTPIA